MKICAGCGESKPEEEFNWANKSKGVRVSRCKDCRRAYNREYYHANSALRDRQREHGIAYRKRAREFVAEYLRTHPCVDCGYSDIRALQFDHIDPLNDSKASRVGRFTAIKRIEEEIAKCEVRCANCHMIKTGTEFGWRRFANVEVE